MAAYTVCFELTQVELGEVDIEARDEAEALRLAEAMDDGEVPYNRQASAFRRVCTVQADGSREVLE